MKTKASRKSKTRKFSPISLVIIIILLVSVIGLAAYSVSGHFAGPVNQTTVNHTTVKQMTFSSINVEYNYTGFLSGYFTNQTIPNIVLNSTNGKFAFDLYITNNNALHNVSIYAVKSLTDGVEVVSENGMTTLAPNQSAELTLQLNSSLNGYDKGLNIEIYSNSSPNIPSTAPVNLSGTGIPASVNPCTASYSNYGYLSYYNSSALNPTYYDVLNINVSHQNARLLLNMSSSGYLYVALFTASQYNQWTQTSDYMPSNISYFKYTTLVDQNVSVPEGDWYFVIWNNESYSINLNHANFYIYYPFITPFTYHFVSYNQTNSSLPSPTGLASYGLTENGNLISPYCLKTNSLLGLASINNISSVYLAPIRNVSAASASLQLNGVLVVNDANGNSFDYWVQNVLYMDTNFNDYYNTIDIFNYTGSSISNFTNLSIQGNGYVYNDGNYTDFRQATQYTSYSLPFSRTIITRSYLDKGKGVWLYFYDIPMNLNSPLSISRITNQTMYAKVFIYDPYAASSYFLVSGYKTLKNSLYYDAEFTLGGGADGEDSYFYNSTSADISLLYLNRSTNTFMRFPSYYTFGSDTAEGAYDLNVTKTSYPYWATANVAWTNSTPSLGYLK